MTIEGIEINAIGIFHINEELSMKFVREEPGGWRPDLIVNHRLHTVGKPPECFNPTEETLIALERTYQDWLIEQVVALSHRASDSMESWLREADQERGAEG